jgi:hypothetical protein
MEKDELAHLEEDIVARAQKLQQDVSLLQKGKAEALARQLRQQLQQEATEKLRLHEEQIRLQTEAAVAKVTQEKQQKQEQIAETQARVAALISELQERQLVLENAKEELEQSAAAAEAYVRTEASEKLVSLEQQLARLVESRVQAFIAALPGV